VIKHFGTKTLFEDATFRASVSLPGNGGSGNDGSSGGSGSGASLGGITDGIQGLLPNTGGSITLAILGAGVLLVSGGFLIRRLTR
jgi:LPXTG-motif cell wall-anchored protein